MGTSLRKMGLNCTMPALVKSKLSSWGTKDELGIKPWSFFVKKSKNDEYILLNSDYLEDLNSSDIDLKGELVAEYKTYFDDKSLKISIKPWITDFYSCELIESSNFAKKKLIDIFVNQNEYVKKDFAYREKNPSLFNNKIELIPN